MVDASIMISALIRSMVLLPSGFARFNRRYTTPMSSRLIGEDLGGKRDQQGCTKTFPDTVPLGIEARVCDGQELLILQAKDSESASVAWGDHRSFPWDYPVFSVGDRLW
jgi:hypothetical protein